VLSYREFDSFETDLCAYLNMTPVHGESAVEPVDSLPMGRGMIARKPPCASGG
jgi:hypothetical protein